MIQLSNREWAILKEMARSFLNNLIDMGGYWSVTDTLVEEEVAILKKLCPDVDGLVERLRQYGTITQSQYERALREYGIEAGTTERAAVNEWMLCYGPKIVEG